MSRFSAGAPAEDAPEAEWETHTAAEDAQIEQERADERALRARYAATFEAYAEAFSAAVVEEARAIEGLTVPVEVKVQADPEATWWHPTDTINPEDDGFDTLAWRLWSAARARVPVPSVLVEVPAEAEGD
ncbi:MAG: hypothetical protein Q4G34_01070 [Micrococcus sp.]|nr:hypothetical protein [Micrococcus sp.]